MNEKRYLGIVIAVIVASVLVAVPQALAQGQCSVATLKGSYGVVEQGVVVEGVIGIPCPCSSPRRMSPSSPMTAPGICRPPTRRATAA